MRPGPYRFTHHMQMVDFGGAGALQAETRCGKNSANLLRRHGMARGFMGKMLWVDLTGRQAQGRGSRRRPGQAVPRRLRTGRQHPVQPPEAGVNPLGPDSISDGDRHPYGTPAITGNRYVAVGKSPLTRVGRRQLGRLFRTNLKFAGYDAVFFSGISRHRCTFLSTTANGAQGRGASLGKDTFETEDILSLNLARKWNSPASVLRERMSPSSPR